MLSPIPPPLHRLLYRFAHWGRCQLWKVRRPTLAGVRVLAFGPGPQVMLIRHSYGSGQWMLPGGGLHKREDTVAAAVRELREETGCTLFDAREVRVLAEDLHGATNVVHLVAGRVTGVPKADRREVIEAGLFALSHLPGPMPARLAEALPQWLELPEVVEIRRG